MVLVQIISRYLESNKRLVIPQLGAFIVKTPGQSVVFSELLKRDDGILRGLLQTAGRSELETAGEIDRFVFEVRHTVQSGGEFVLGGLGVMNPGPNDTIAFRYDPQPAKAAEPESAAEQAPPPAHTQRSEPLAATSGSTEKERAESDIKEPRVSPSAKLNPEPYVKGLRYGKPRKNTNAYTYINGRRRIDRFLLAAIVAAILAVCVIVYVFVTSSHDEEPATEQTEQTEQSTADTGIPASDETAASPTQTNE